MKKYLFSAGNEHGEFVVTKSIKDNELCMIITYYGADYEYCLNGKQVKDLANSLLHWLTEK